MGALYNITKQSKNISQWYFSHYQFKGLNFDIINLNSQGLKDYTKGCKIFNFMKKDTLGKDIIFMQETHNLETCENIWTNQFGCGNNHIVFSHGTSDSRAVIFVFQEASN